MMLELTEKEATDLVAIMISVRSGLRGAAKQKHKIGMHNAALHTDKLADFSEVLSTRLIDLGAHVEVPVFQLAEDGIDYRVD